ncbi:hypothetical protein HPB50_013545 [Hyalomma asiaticum]|uniref:Uncharacterized protein n=1 Tax=Hyalomma asiaticum TaxID=266040 RepID=A0ACB7SGY6_HYAAI|nr:hypothetical protein HPB50_013545 [Hyalomma asiaticum]
MLLTFLEQYPSLAQRSFSATPYFTAADRRRLWREIAEALNAEGPIQKTSEQWQLWWRKQVFAALHDSRAVEEAQSTGSGRLPGYRGRILQMCGLSRFTGSRRLDYQTQLPDVAAAVEVATMPAPRPPRRPVRRPRPPRPRRADVLGEMAAQCSRTLDQGINMIVVGGPLPIRKFRA